jgi:D-alanyl-D-alanine dipeptidase
MTDKTLKSRLEIQSLGPSEPIPDFDKMNSLKAGYRDSVAIDFESSSQAEKLVDVRSLGIAGHNHYFIESNPPYFEKVPGAIEELYLRESVAEKLCEVNLKLEGLNLELYLFDGWRPQAIQRHFHDVWFPQWLRTHRPEIKEDQLVEEVEKYWAAPSESEDSPSPHSTGGAVDLTLRWLYTKQAVYMGGIFDDLTENAHSDWFERFEVEAMSDIEARKNRRLLYWAMIEAGFVNNPTEWWHFSYGDQMWAKLLSQESAIYAATEPQA